MLRWREELRVGFSPDRIVLARLARGFRPRVTEKFIIPVSPMNGRAAWEAPLAVLAEVLRAQVRRPAGAAVILSNRFVRYAVVPWHDALMKREERLAQARHCFKEIYGEVAASWSVQIQDGRFREPVLATAVPAELIASLRQIFKEARLPLQSVLPYLTAAYATFRRALARRSEPLTWLSVVERDDLSALCVHKGELRDVFNQRVHGEWLRELQGMLLQLAGETTAGETMALCVFAPEKADSKPEEAKLNLMRLSLPALPGYSSSSDAALSLALVGIR